MPISKAPAWNIAVLTWPGRSAYSNLRNSLLYGDHVHWVSLDSIAGITAYIIESATRSRVTGRKSNFTVDEVMTGSLATIPEYAAFEAEIATSRAENVITRHFDLQYLGELVREAQNAGVAQGSEINAELRASIERSAREDMEFIVKDSRVIASPDSPDKTQVDPWNAYEAAHALALSLSRLLLPDVSTLPLEVILELRGRLVTSLNPMRAELLRFTETLRAMIGEKLDSGTLSVEARNLVATKVEPVVREADQRARELLDAKWRKLLVGAAKAFGLAGASFVDAKMLAKAVQQTLETTALALGESEDKTPVAKATSQFVLQACSFLADRID